MTPLATFTHPTITQIGTKYWFHEINDSFPGQSFGLEVVRILHHTESTYQDILVFESATFGNVLVLNGIVQCTEKDEFAYQELITHVPIMCHQRPAKVLVIGGGDCGVVRELVKHLDDGVELIVMVEIDRAVIDLSIKYLPHMAKFHNHPKVQIVIDDGFKYLEKMSGLDLRDKYDVIITDSSDPEGPAQEFFDANYYALLKNALKPDGIVAMQSSENIWLNLPYLCDLLGKARQVFENVEYCQCYMPSYTSGQLGLVIATPARERDLKKPVKDFDVRTGLFKYYSAKVHEASFVLPRWAADEIAEKAKEV